MCKLHIHFEERNFLLKTKAWHLKFVNLKLNKKVKRDSKLLDQFYLKFISVFIAQEISSILVTFFAHEFFFFFCRLKIDNKV